eukprot:1716454-Pleurochrysis_carterae.AAC.1
MGQEQRSLREGRLNARVLLVRGLLRLARAQLALDRLLLCCPLFDVRALSLPHELMLRVALALVVRHRRQQSAKERDRDNRTRARVFRWHVPAIGRAATLNINLHLALGACVQAHGAQFRQDVRRRHEQRAGVREQDRCVQPRWHAHHRHADPKDDGPYNVHGVLDQHSRVWHVHASSTKCMIFPQAGAPTTGASSMLPGSALPAATGMKQNENTPMKMAISTMNV